jgi:hypothetical protein
MKSSAQDSAVPPAPGKGKIVGVRMHQSQIEALDRWAARNDAAWRGPSSRAQIIRQLIAKALSQSPR